MKTYEEERDEAAKEHCKYYFDDEFDREKADRGRIECESIYTTGYNAGNARAEKVISHLKEISEAAHTDVEYFALQIENNEFRDAIAEKDAKIQFYIAENKTWQNTVDIERAKLASLEKSIAEKDLRIENEEHARLVMREKLAHLENVTEDKRIKIKHLESKSEDQYETILNLVARENFRDAMIERLRLALYNYSSYAKQSQGRGADEALAELKEWKKQNEIL